MIELFQHPENFFFSLALVTMLVFAGIEIVSTLVGFGASQLVDQVLPDFDVDADVDIDIDADVDIDATAGGTSTPFLVKVISLVKARNVPFLVVLIVYLTLFSLSGILMQMGFQSIFGYLIPAEFAVWPPFLLSAVCTKSASGVLGRYLFKDETTAISRAELIGMEGQINIGTARLGFPAEAKIRDQHGQLHYIMVEPETEGEEILQSESVVITGKKGNVFRAAKRDELPGRSTEKLLS